MQLTILATDDNPGLQLYLNGEWQGVPPMKDAFIINLGDLLERCDSQRFQKRTGWWPAYVCVWALQRTFVSSSHVTWLKKRRFSPFHAKSVGNTLWLHCCLAGARTSAYRVQWPEGIPFGLYVSVFYRALPHVRIMQLPCPIAFPARDSCTQCGFLA